MRIKADGFDDLEGELPGGGSLRLVEEDAGSIDFSPEMTDDDLLEPESWARLLDLFARTANVAVALIDTKGQLVGKCHNANPIWSLARAARPVPAGTCLFCLETSPNCTAIADALLTNSLVFVHEDSGFAHVALPLTLGGLHIGTLLAGQILDRFPEQLPLQRTAREFGLSSQQVWDLARQQIPTSRARLTIYGELLWEVGQTFLRNCHGFFLERRSIEKAKVLNRELSAVNTKLRRKIAELDQSLVERETLLREVHHRVKNNLQVVSSLLSLQMGLEVESPTSGLRESYNRIQSMSLVHEYIYQSKTLADLDIGEYTERLANHLYRSYCEDRKRIQLSLKTETMRLGIGQSVPYGLILNELIANALKHAFTDGRSGLLEIRFRKTGDSGAELIVADNGVGLPAGFDPISRKSMGMQVVEVLTSQLGAHLDISRDGGTRFVLSWTVPPAEVVLQTPEHAQACPHP
jgi:two-component sensor histidine kinase/ligand-binding sensor protein